MANIDIKGAYYSILILEKYQKYLKYLFWEKPCQFTCLPNGLRSIPRKFTKLLKALFAHLHKKLIDIDADTDDLFTYSPK